MAKQQNAHDAPPTLLPVGLGPHIGDYNRIFVDTFQRVVLRGQPLKQVLDREAEDMQRFPDTAKAPCWAPDPVSQDTCRVN